MDERQFSAQLQPIMNIKINEPSSYEILSRCEVSINIEHFFRDVTPSLGAAISLKVLADTMNAFSDEPKFLQFNLSPKQLVLAETKETLEVLLANYPADHVMCELTELDFDDIDSLVNAMNHFINIGMQFSLDDYGSGNSSLERLVRLPIKQIKIDRQFITDIKNCPKQQYIVKHLSQFADVFDIEIVCEGVETEEQHLMLLSLGVTYAQGWHYARPFPLSEIASPKQDRVIEFKPNTLTNLRLVDNL